jgi:hypothetical protein
MVSNKSPSGPARRRLLALTTVHEAAGYEWTSTRWLRRQVAERRLPFHKAVGRILLDLNDIDELTQQGRVEAVR